MPSNIKIRPRWIVVGIIVVGGVVLLSLGMKDTPPLVEEEVGISTTFIDEASSVFPVDTDIDTLVPSDSADVDTARTKCKCGGICEL